MLGKEPKPKCETHMLSTHQIQTQNFLYKVCMAVTYHLRPGMAFITKTQTSTVSSFSEVDALKQNQTQEISGEKRTEFLLFLRCQKQRTPMYCIQFICPNACEGEGAHPVSDSRPACSVGWAAWPLAYDHLVISSRMGHVHPTQLRLKVI